MQSLQGIIALPLSAPTARKRLSVLLAALSTVAAAHAQQAPLPSEPDAQHAGTHTTYRVINLAPGLLATIPDINAKGQVAFSMQASPGATAHFYNGRTVQNIGSLGGSEVLTADLNDLGQIVGSSTSSLDVERAFVWSAGGGMFDIGAATGAGYSEAAAINNAGVVTGIALYGWTYAFRWSSGTGMENVTASATNAGFGASGMALNEAGVIGGMVGTQNNSRHAFTWTRASGMVDIDNLDSADAMPVALGSGGEVGGNRLDSLVDIAYRPFLWTRTTGMVDLGSGGGVAAAVLAMTPCLRMAGLISYADDTQRAMTWTRSGGMRNIGTLGGRWSRAYDVNAGGEVVGYAENRRGERRAFIWSAKKGMLDLNRFLRHAPRGLVLDDALAISSGGAIVATSNAGLVLLRPEKGHKGGHVLGPIVAPALVKVGMPLRATVAFVDEERVGTRSVSWSWGDGSATQAGQVRDGGTEGEGGATHSFSAPGIYTVAVTVVDRSGRSTVVSQEVVVSDPAGAMVVGRGAVMSPLGALRRAPLRAVKAQFSLIAPVAGTVQTRAGGAKLHFDLPGLSFRSQDLRLKQRQGDRLEYEGSGTVRGVGGYQFVLTTSPTTSGTVPGRFGIKIWHADAANKRDVVDYDNTRKSSSSIAEGQIVAD